jgi:hypothetical protein
MAGDKMAPLNSAISSGSSSRLSASVVNATIFPPRD